MQVVEKHCSSHGQKISSFTIAFEKDSVSLEIPEKYPKCSGWKITPIFNAKVSSSLCYVIFQDNTILGVSNGLNPSSLILVQITRQQVNCFSSGKTIPKCELLLEWGQDTPPASLSHKIHLIGARDHNFFLLHVNPGK